VVDNRLVEVYAFSATLVGGFLIGSAVVLQALSQQHWQRRLRRLATAHLRAGVPLPLQAYSPAELYTWLRTEPDLVVQHPDEGRALMRVLMEDYGDKVPKKLKRAQLFQNKRRIGVQRRTRIVEILLRRQVASGSDGDARSEQGM
jgi:hypothetical protein